MPSLLWGSLCVLVAPDQATHQHHTEKLSQRGGKAGRLEERVAGQGTSTLCCPLMPSRALAAQAGLGGASIRVGCMVEAGGPLGLALGMAAQQQPRKGLTQIRRAVEAAGLRSRSGGKRWPPDQSSAPASVCPEGPRQSQGLPQLPGALWVLSVAELWSHPSGATSLRSLQSARGGRPNPACTGPAVTGTRRI